MNQPQPTHLRDARLRHALEHAPDAQAAPAEATRAAILRHAHEAVAPVVAVSTTARPAPWWARLARALAGASRPWNAGFASVLLACVVAGLWWERDVPGPAPQARGPAVPMPAPVTREAARQTDSAAPASVPEADASAAPQARETVRETVREKAQPAPRPARPQPQPVPPPAQAEQPVAPPSPAPSGELPAEAPMRSRAPSPRAEADDAQSAPAPAPPPAASSAGATAIAPAASGSPAASALQPGASLALVRPAPAAASAAFAWTALQLQPATAPARARGSLPADVQQAIDSLLRAGATAVPAEAPVLARIALLYDGGVVLGVLELGSHSMRWTPASDRTRRAFAARVEPATSQRVRDALAQ